MTQINEPHRRREAIRAVKDTSVHSNYGQSGLQKTLASKVPVRPTPLFLPDIRICRTFCDTVYQRVVLDSAALSIVLGSVHSNGCLRFQTTSTSIIRAPKQDPS